MHVYTSEIKKLTVMRSFELYLRFTHQRQDRKRSIREDKQKPELTPSGASSTQVIIIEFPVPMILQGLLSRNKNEITLSCFWRQHLQPALVHVIYYFSFSPRFRRFALTPFGVNELFSGSFGNGGGNIEERLVCIWTCDGGKSEESVDIFSVRWWWKLKLILGLI